tara:strand:+ start:5030 stop:5209 length:180 start_codon:yes stop_codon:yes gene_type:complete
MSTRKKAVITGIGTILAAGAMAVAWRKSDKQREKLSAWKKEKIENMYYNNIDERDIPQG